MRLPLAFLLLAATAVAADERERAFRWFDLDGDGKISLAEAAGYEEIVLRFDKGDRNRDGKLSAAEFRRLARIKLPRAARPASAAAGGTSPQNDAPGRKREEFDWLDRNGDGFVTRGEARVLGGARRFESTDANGDGKLSRREFYAAQRKKR
jgi:Ca2+-binding EF-hand superfamily protein